MTEGNEDVEMAEEYQRRIAIRNTVILVAITSMIAIVVAWGMSLVFT